MSPAEAPLQSSLCEGSVFHGRSAPGHAFRYSIFMLLLDLGELPVLGRRLSLFGYNEPRLFTFRDRDHLGGTADDLRADLERAVRGAGVPMPGGRVELLTHARILGYVFNPVSFYYCYDRDGTLSVVVAEVNNTYGDRHSYVLPVRDASFEWRTKKVMHVSPFFQPDAGTYTWALRPPAQHVDVGVNLTRGGATLLAARLSLVRRPLTDAALVSALLRHPLMTLTVTGAIHFEALRLSLKKVPFWPRPPYDPELARGGPS